MPCFVETGPVDLNIFNLNLLFFFYNVVALHLNKLDSPPSKVFCVTFGLNWLGGTGVKFFKNTFNIILHFRYYHPLEKGVTLYLNKLESLYQRMHCAMFG